MKLVDRFIDNQLIKRGFDKKRATRYRERMTMYWKNTPISFGKKLWAAKHGFFADKVELYGLTEKNCKSFLSDYDRLWLHPMNNHFAFWINDKITLKYMLQKPFVIDGVEYDVMPEYYLYIENDGHYTYLMDSPAEIAHDSEYLFNLLKKKKELAVKLTNGEKGKGFYKLQYNDGNVLSNGELMTEAFSDFEKSLKGYVVTEYCHQHSDMAKVWDKSECTLRVVAVRNIKDRYSANCALVKGVDIIVSFARFGSSISGGASNLSQGGVGIPFDFETGIYGENFMRYKEFCPDGQTSFPAHPDTKVVLSGKQLPNWELVKKATYAVCDHLASLEMLGLDIIITQEGLKLCEINSLPAFDYAQVMCGPLMDKPQAAEFFNKKKNLKRNKK